MGSAVAPNQSVSRATPTELKALQTDVEDQQREEPGDATSSCSSDVDGLKNDLRSLLTEYKGSTKHPDVGLLINKLSELNPPPEDCIRSSALLGEWFALTCPNFPGRIDPQEGEEDKIQYKLGRLSFNIFQPSNLVCTLRSVRNPVSSQSIGLHQGQKTFSYPLILDITIHTPDGDLPAILVNEAFCYENKDVNNRLMVSFTGGTLLPAEEMKTDTTKLKLWSRTFEGAYKKAEAERSYFGRFFYYIIKLLLGLTVPTDDTLLQNTFHFDLKRSPVGFLDILYLDGDLRITRGNRGTLVVVERSAPLSPEH